MGKIFYIIGKSATGKDFVLSAVLRDPSLGLHKIVQYTTRPIRDRETEGVEYHFISDSEERRLSEAGRIIEERVYETVHGPWKYMMVDDGQIDLEKADYAAVGTVESYVKVRDYFGADRVVPIYIYVETGERLQRALNRERKNAEPKYRELCRRFLADENDFSDEKLAEAGLFENGQYRNGVENIEKEDTVARVAELIRNGI